MARFQDGDRVQVPDEVKEVNVELIGAMGTITAQRAEARERLGPWEPLYEVQFDDIDGMELVEESRLEPSSE